MFSFNKKLDANLKSLIKLNNQKSYRVLIKCKNFQDSISRKISAYKCTVIREIQPCNIICAKINSKSIERLLEYPEVEYICLDQHLFLCGMSLPTANKVRLSNKLNLNGNGVGVGVIDSGVYPHRDLTLPSNRIATFVDLINGLNYPYDDNGHGTCTCGIIAGNGEASKGMYKGIASHSNIYCYKAFDKHGKGFVSDILFSLNELIDMSEKYNIKVLCLPFESLDFNAFIFNSFDILLKKAIIKHMAPIIPSGSNRNEDGSITGIALSSNCITVSGVDTTSEVRSYTYSSCGATKKDSKPNFCAACVDVVSLNCNASYISEKNNTKIYAPKLDTSYKSFTGTSISAAYVAGLCAILYEQNPTLKFIDILSLLNVSSELYDLPLNQQGLGKININKILK